MKSKSLLVAGVLVGLFLSHSAGADDKSTSARVAEDKSIPTGEPDEKTILRIQKVLDETEIETKEFKDKMPLPKFFAALEAKLPKDKKLTFHIDKEAFGADFAKVSEAAVNLVHGRGNEKTSLHTALWRALRQLPKGVEADYGFRGNGIVLTRPMLATHRTVYDIRDIVAYLPIASKEGILLHPSRVLQKQTDGDDVAFLVRLTNSILELRPWETIEILNRTRLVFSASPARHDELRDLFSALRRLSDAWVVMNARIYEVDRKFYTKEIAPLFAKPKLGEQVPPIQPIAPGLFKKITRGTMLVEGEEIKIHPGQSADFLSRQTTVLYAGPQQFVAPDKAGPEPKNPKKKATDADLTGVSFQVTAHISPDRRFIQAHVTQTVSQLLGIDKTKMHNPFTDKEIEIETPNLRKSTVTGTVKLPDGHPILMPVEYRPPGNDKKDKVWLLVARPFIWIEEEVQERRADGQEFNQKTVWESDVVEDEEEPSAKLLPMDLETKQILQAIIKDVLTNPKLKDVREVYGSAKDKTLTLVDTPEFGWSKDFKPATHGYKLVNVDPFDPPRRVLGIRIHKFDLTQKDIELNDTPVEICLFDAGGRPAAFCLRGCTLYCIPMRVGMDWKVECLSWESRDSK